MLRTQQGLAEKRMSSLELPYPFSIRPLTVEEGGGYLIEFPDLPGCMADGETIEEAVREGKDALRSWIETMRDLRGEIPPSPAEAHGSVDDQALVRVPRPLHRLLAKRARTQGVSPDALATTLLDDSLRRRG